MAAILTRPIVRRKLTLMNSATSPQVEEAVVVVIRRGGRVLVIERGPESRKSGYWSPPSGRIESGESQAQTVVREMREELGLEVRPVAKVWETRTDDGAFLLHWWLADEDGGTITPHPGEVSQAIWVTAEEFLRLDRTFHGGREFFRNVLPTLAR